MLRTPPCRRAAACLGSLILIALTPVLPHRGSAFAEGASREEDQLQVFRDEVLPILQQNCLKCHSGDEPEGGLKLTSRQAILAGGESGPALNSDDLAASLLIEAINYESFEMPPTGKLPPTSIDILTAWVKQGAPMPAGEIEVDSQDHGPPQVNEQTRNHWSFRPLQRPDVPVPADPQWGGNPIDAFVLARLESAGLSPSPPADRRTLIRRVHYDLLGLPPAPSDVEAFAADDSPHAYERLIETLLKSPRYGEQWARYWLDVVRYAESNSYERDNPKPFVWRYRDYVIDAFNKDKPYDQFIREQLAGDELHNASPETIIATGFYRLGLWDDEPVDAELAFYDGLDDIAATTAQAFLGLTMNCARCHDHKLDPISQHDYYSFISFFRNIRHYGVRADETVFAASVRDVSTAEQRTAFEEERRNYEQRVADLRAQLDAVEDDIRPHLQGGEKDDFQDDSVRLGIIGKYIGQHISQNEFDEYARQRKAWTDLRNAPPRSAHQALCITEHGRDCPPTFLLARGSPAAKGDEVFPAFPAVLSAPAPEIIPPESNESCGRRLALANWIASPHNPLAARVMVNRIWQWHFGRGLVRSPNNFGLQGDAPTHPQLLDWLAAEFIDRGWSIKQMHRLILTSNTYRMSSAGSPAGLDLDPQNNLFWRFDMRRLRAEEIRDSILAVNGSLNIDKMYGPSIYEVIPPEVLAGQSRPGAGWGTSSPEDRRRRSIYIHVKRSLAVPLLAAFDAADTDFTCPVRFATTQPTQALSMLNSEFVGNEAVVFADFVRETAGDVPADQVTFILARVTQRPPEEHEVSRGVRLMASLQTDHDLSHAAALRYFCVLALNLNEFLYLD